MKCFEKKLKKGRKKLELDNEKDLSYESGMMGPGSRTAKTNKKRKISNVTDGCPHSVLETDRQSTSKLCPNNPNKWCWEEEGRADNDGPTGNYQMEEREEMTLTGGGLNTTTNKNKNDENKDRCPCCGLEAHR
jgi:hypothetical protein